MKPKTLDLAPYTSEDGTVAAYAWPGGYPLFYLTADCGTLCPKCVNAEREVISHADEGKDDQWRIVAVETNWEDPELFCDNCDERIESAYAEDDYPGENPLKPTV